MTYRFFVVFAIVILLLALPRFVGDNFLDILVQILIASLFAMSFNMLNGGAGLLSFGHAAFFGLGAFAAVHTMNGAAVPLPLVPMVGWITGILAGLLFGWFATKRSGVYFSMITLALAELLYSIAPHLSSTFGGEAGVSTMRAAAFGIDFGSDRDVYYLVLIWVLAALGLIYFLGRSPFGQVVAGLKDNRSRMRFLGYDTHHIGCLAFAISAAFAGLAGALQSINTESANYILFDSSYSSAVVLNSYIGGVNYFLGPLLGAALITLFGYVMSDVSRSWLLYQGLIFIVVMMVVPDGMLGLVFGYTSLRAKVGTLRTIISASISAVGLVLTAIPILLLSELIQKIYGKEITVHPLQLFVASTLSLLGFTLNISLGALVCGSLIVLGLGVVLLRLRIPWLYTQAAHSFNLVQEPRSDD